MGPGAPDMAGMILLSFTMLAFTVVMWGVSWRAIICTNRIYALRWYYAHPIAMLGGLVSAMILCITPLLVWRVLPENFTFKYFPLALIGIYCLVLFATIIVVLTTSFLSRPGKEAIAL